MTFLITLLLLGITFGFSRRSPRRRKKILACLESGPRGLDELHRELGHPPWLVRVLFHLRGQRLIEHVYPDDFATGEIRYILLHTEPTAF